MQIKGVLSYLQTYRFVMFVTNIRVKTLMMIRIVRYSISLWQEGLPACPLRACPFSDHKLLPSLNRRNLWLNYMNTYSLYLSIPVRNCRNTNFNTDTYVRWFCRCFPNTFVFRSVLQIYSFLIAQFSLLYTELFHLKLGIELEFEYTL